MRIFLDDKLMCSLSCDIVMCDIIRHCARSTDMSTARRQPPTSRQGVLLHGRSPCRRRPLLRERIVCRHLLLRQAKGCPAFVSLTCILVQFCCETIIESRLTGVRLQKSCETESMDIAETPLPTNGLDAMSTSILPKLVARSARSFDLFGWCTPEYWSVTTACRTIWMHSVLDGERAKVSTCVVESSSRGQSFGHHHPRTCTTYCAT